MDKKNLIPAKKFCANHNIEISSISLLHENGLMEITTIRKTRYIHKNQLPELEKIMRFYCDLDINLEGIEAIIHLLNRINKMQDEIAALNSMLLFYQTND